uniref:Mitogen-activated protein kinase n=1 Tax=Cacopsylla melanoneura TaxID=428564 RepID=A0A8D9E9H6_9HEMI
MASNTTSKTVDKVQHNVDGHILADYTIHRRIGKGAYGIVYKAYDKKNKQYIAIKKIFDAFCNKTDAQRTYREILFLKSFQRHPNIITMLDVFKALNNKDLYVIFEYMENDLNKVIKEKILKDVHIRFIMFQLCNGLAYIHACKVMHRDLKPSNILINKSCSIKIADLGLARSLNDRNVCLTEYIATRWYRAPEILISKGQYTHRVDIWSLGCILAEMLQSKPLFPGASTNHQLQLVVNVIRTNPPHADKFYAGFKSKFH